MRGSKCASTTRARATTRRFYASRSRPERARWRAGKASELLGVSSGAFDVGVGTAWFGTFGQGLVFGDVTPMVGVERFDDEISSLGTLRAGFGGGIVLRESTTHSQGFLWNKVETQKTALTIELTGNADFPFNRAPQYSFGLLVGVAWINFVE